MAVRRGHAVALVAVGALLLLLLARLPPAPPTPLRPDPLVYLISGTSDPINRTIVPVTSSIVSVVMLNVTIPPPHNRTQPVASTKEEKRNPEVVLTRDVYEAGHSRPHPELCPALGSRLRLLVLVTSAPSHATARDAIRLTWGHYAARSDISIAFVLGKPPESLVAPVASEDDIYGDMIVGHSVDSYSNLTLKTISMLEWVDTYCPRVPRILKTDDDMFINVPKLLDFIASPLRATAVSTIWGKVVKKSLPKRTIKSKYYVSPVQFPGKVFPEFATGPAYLMTGDTVRPLLLAAPSEPYVRLEDVFVTGVLASLVGIRRVPAAEFYNKKVALHPCVVQRGVAIHMVRYHEQFDLWRKLLDGKSKCRR